MRGTMQYLSADFRDGQITVAGKKYPAGTFCVHLLNRFYAHDTAARIAVFKTNILQVQRTLESGYMIDTDFIKTGTDILHILQTLPKLKPFDRLDTEAEKRRITALFQKETADHLSDFLRQKGMESTRDEAALYLNGAEPDHFHEMVALLQDVNDALRFYETISDDICEAFEALCAFVDQIDTCERFDEAHLLPLAVRCFAKRRAAFETEYVPLQKTRKSKAAVTVRRLCFSDFYSFIVTDFFEGLHDGHYPRRCAACENCFLMQSARRQKYCASRKALMTVNGRPVTCRKYGVYVKKKEQAKDHPVIDRYTRRCACIRVDFARGNIDEAFAAAAKALAKEHRFRAIHEPEYEASGYVADMTRDKLYRDTAKRMKKRTVRKERGTLSKEEKTNDAVVVDEWRLFACATLPKHRPEYDDMIKLYLKTRDEKNYEWLLDAYELRLNTLARIAVERYGMYGHFADIKMAMALGLHKALQSYDPVSGVPFMIYKNRFIKSEVHSYIRTMRTGYSVPTAARYAVLRKAMALYHAFDKKSDEATLERIAREIRHSVKYSREIIAAGLRMQSFVDFFVFYTDSNGEEARADVTTDNSTNPEQVFFASLRSEAVLNAFESLDYRERMLVAAHLGFCPECFETLVWKEKEGAPVLAPRKKQSLVDLAIEHELADPDSVHEILERAYGKMREQIWKSGQFTTEL